ncbi:phosphotransferase [Pseudomonas sp. PDM23]|uniref:phosphotransferase enzyme family protein n=1 Tax=unclassified Pseudomonas TaxID=196821 RepID=UPI0017810F4A|nr:MULTISPECIES: phosphotransferase [unclassified Pseudomonas]MBD9504286.1 phosphotransferase [Pseudomonas sp. PDM17]MBD9578671.1 phosphotransferase [Pseudomonas sp. PDM23]MBD9673995.1 phosphotransferase [Pseudomonas sp. PDM21]
MTKRLSHGMGLEPVEPDWPALTEAEVASLLEDFPQAGANAHLTWHSPRPFSAAALVETDGGPLFVKRHHPGVRSATALAEEHAFLDHLARRGAPVAQVLRDSHGYSAIARNGWTYEVHRKAKGLDLYRDALSWTPFQHNAHAFAAGVALARLHHAAEGFDAPARSTDVLFSNLSLFGAEDPIAAIEATLLQAPALAEYLQARPWQETLSELHLPLQRHLLPYLGRQPALWTHNDWHASNLLWNEDSRQAQVVSILDFGLSDRTFALFDLTTAIERNLVPWLELDQGRAAVADLDGLDALLQGYASVRPLSRDDLLALTALLPLVHADFALSEIGYFHGLLGSEENASLAYDNYLIGHTRWFQGSEGQRLLNHLRQLAARAN